MCEGSCNNSGCPSYNEQVMDNCPAYDTGKLRERCNDFMPENADPLGSSAAACYKADLLKAAASASNSRLIDGLYSKTDMMYFAAFYYGPDIDALDADAQFECKRIDGALEYWTKHIRGIAV